MLLKKFILLLILLWSFQVQAQFGDSFPVLKFDQDTVDFGVVIEGDTVRYDFKFTNVGNKPLVIKQAYPACGCTYPTCTKGSILPGQRGLIHVEFYSQGWAGQHVLKEVIVILGNGPENYARFKAHIIKRPDAIVQPKNKNKRRKQK